MPVSHGIGAPDGIWAVITLLLVAGCLAVAWRRVGSSATAKGQRGRLREFGSCIALVVVAVILADSVDAGQWAIGALGAALVLLLRPRAAAGITSALLLILGLVGIYLARWVAWEVPRPGWYGLAHSWNSPMWFLLVQAYVFLALGAWLGWRELRARPAIARLVLGRAADQEPADQLWSLLLLAVVVVGSAIISADSWLFVMIIGSVAAAAIIRRAPGVAAKLTAVGLIGLGLTGLLLVKSWTVSGPATSSPPLSASPAPSSAAASPSVQKTILSKPTTPKPAAPKPPRAQAAAVVAPYPAARYGLVGLQSGGTADVALAEALVFLGVGCWLVPRSFPSVRKIIGLVPRAQLTSQVQHLARSRAVAVDTAAADLRRLERDLHDGAQARLVALGMNLRAAERLMHVNPEAAAALVAEAREASARALTELRELVRGVHPPVLADRGLADAVRALALDSPLNVETEIDLPGRLPAPVETACYFSIAELLTNAAKHSGARDARIAIRHSGLMLRVEVTDFGLGGADPARGSGLAGIEKRLASFDGILAVSSPPGGPTMAVMEVPCASSLPRISSS
jgi:signal transduction histidine kinase